MNIMRRLHDTLTTLIPGFGNSIVSTLLLAFMLISMPAMAIQNTASGTSNGVTLDTSQATVTLTRDASGLVVTNTNDSGPGSLRQAMTNAVNGSTITFDTTVFNPANAPAVVTINLLSALPTITQGSVTIDASNVFAIIDGGGIVTDGIVISSSNNTIMGMQVQNFAQDGIEINSGNGNTIGGDSNNGAGPNGEGNVIISNTSAGIRLSGTADGNFIYGNLVGIDVNNNPLGNGSDGISLDTDNNFVGDASVAGRRNVVSDNGAGIHVFGGNSNTIQNNLVGTDINGISAIGNGWGGIVLAGGGTLNTVGGTTAAQRNVIAGTQTSYGVTIDSSNSNTIQGNNIGVAVDGTTALANAGGGIRVINTADLNIIGGTVSGAGNIVARNSGDGITHSASGTTSIYGNYIGTDSGLASLPNTGNGISITAGTVNLGDASETQSNIVGPNGGNGIDLNGGILATAGVVDINDDVVLTTGTFNMGMAQLSLSGNWNNIGATVDANTSLITLDGVNQSISGSTTFASLTKSVAATDTLTFETGSTQTFTGTVTLNGASGQLLNLRSSSSPALWNFVLTSTATDTISFVSVQDSNAAGSDASQIPVNPASSQDVSNNFGWFSVASPPTDLAITHTVDNATPNEGDTVTYTITLTNNGPATATNVSIDDVLPAGLVFVSATPSQGSFTAPTWTVGTVNVSASATLTIQATVGAGTAGTLVTNTLSNLLLDQTDSNATAYDLSEDITVGTDTVAPEQVTDLNVSSRTDTSVTLTWTAPGDNINLGTATSYDIRYSTVPITAGTWPTDTQAVGEPVPAIAGSTESFTITGLSANNTYYFAIIASDEVPNTGTLSNVLVTATYGDAVNAAAAEVTPAVIATGSTGSAFSYFVLPSVNAGNNESGVNQVVVSVPAEITNVAVTGVTVIGAGVLTANCPASGAQYCANVAGNTVTIDLGSNANNGERIQIDMAGDAGTVPGAYAFSASVDDTATASVPAQAVAGGDADGNAGNSNNQLINIEGFAASTTVSEVTPATVSVNQLSAINIDVLPTINTGIGNTGVNQVVVTVPAGFVAPVISDVQVGGVSVAFTDNSTAGQLVADLTATVTTTQTIRIVSSMTSPSTPASYTFGVQVDDTATTSATAQIATAGNADAIAGNSDTLDLVVQTSADSIASTVTVNPQIVIADGTPSVITVTLRDGNGIPKPNRQVQLSTSRQATTPTEVVTQPTGNTDANGVATGSVAATTPGATTVYALDVMDGIVLAAQPQVYFTQGMLLNVTMTANKSQASVGEVVTYVMEIRNNSAQDVVSVNLRNAIPHYFKYVKSSAQRDGTAIAPGISARSLNFDLGTMPALVDSNGNGVADPGEAGYTRIIYQLVIGSGAQPGEYENSLRAVDVCNACYISNNANVSVDVVQDALFDLGTIIGKVFEDKNKNSQQDDGEEGIANTMVVLDDGTYVITDEFGRYSIPAVQPGQRAIKINLTTVSDVATTDQETKIVQVTPGLLVKANFPVNYHYDTETIGRPREYGVKIESEQINQPMKIQGNVRALSLLVNGKLTSFSRSNVKLGVGKVDNVVVVTGGKLKEPVKFTTEIGAVGEIEAWELDIYDRKGEIVRTLSGEDKPPETIIWDGQTSAGKLVEGGRMYQYQLSLKNYDGTRAISARRNFGVNRETAITLNLTDEAFKGDSNKLTSSAKQLMKNIASVLKQYPEEIVTIEGHTDDSGLENIDRRRSVQRARAAMNYLVDIHGIDRHQFMVMGYGSEKPIADNETPEGRKLNRRIEIKGTMTEIDPSTLREPFHQPPSVRINNQIVSIDPYGRFSYEHKEEEVDEIPIELTSPNGQSISTLLEIPTIEVMDPLDLSLLSDGTSSGRYEVFDLNEDADLTDNVSFVMYTLTGRSAPGNEIVLNGVKKAANQNGIFNFPLNLKHGKNTFDFTVTNETGFTSIVQLVVSVTNEDEDGNRIVTVSQVPNMTVHLPPEGRQLTTSELIVSGVTDAGNKISVNGNPVQVDANGRFRGTVNLPMGHSLMMVAATDPEGNTGVVSRQVELVEEKLFLLAFADGEFGQLDKKGNVKDGEKKEFYSEGRVAYYLRGKIAGEYLIRSAYDSQRKEVGKLFSNINESQNERLLTNLDPNKIYPVYGDSSSLTYDAQSQGKFYLAIDSDELSALIGNYQLNMNDTELARYQRSFYGVRVAYQSASKTKHGDPDIKVMVFGAEVEQVPVTDEIRSTGGSLYYLSRNDIIEGSEQVTILVRDKDTGLTLSRVTQVQNTDYNINYDLGRILFERPISSFSDDSSLFNENILAGHPVYIQVDYEARSSSLENKATGGYVRKQITDDISVGATHIDDKQVSSEYSLQGIDTEVRVGEHSRIVAEVAKSEGTEGIINVSEDGGLSFAEYNPGGVQKGNAWKAATEVDFGKMLDWQYGFKVSAYVKQLDPEFQSAGNTQESGTRKTGIDVAVKPTERDQVTVNYAAQDPLSSPGVQTLGSSVESTLFDVQWKHTRETWTVTSGYQSRDSEINNLDQKDSDYLAAEFAWHPDDKLKTRIKHQQTVSGEENTQTSAGVDYKVTNNVGVSSSVAQGSNGEAAEASINIGVGDGKVYITERVVDENQNHSTSTIVGAEQKVSESTQVYSEYQREQASTSDRDVSVVGTRSNWMITEGLSFRLVSEYGHSETDSGYASQYALAVGLTYNHPAGFKLSTRDEMRRQWGDRSIEQFVTTNKAEVKLSPDYTALAKVGYSHSKDTDLDETIAQYRENSIGLAYRPTKNDKFNALMRYTVIDDLRTLTVDIDTISRTRMDVLSIEWSWQFNDRFEWVDKLAIKERTESVGNLPGTESTTMLSLHRLNYNIWKSLEFGIEYRILEQREADDKLNGWLTELMWRVNRYTRLGVGYNFTDFSDNEFSNNDYSVRGIFMRLQAVY